MVKLLLDHNADANAADKDGETPLSIAIERVNTDMVKLLLDHGANANAAKTKGETPLSRAIGQGNTDTDIVKLLLDHGANANATNAAGETPLRIAISKLGNNDVVKLLLDHHADANMESSGGQSLMITPLGLAVNYNHPEMVKMLLQDHADPNAADSNGETPLLTAIRLDKSEIVKLLLDNHANANMEAVSAGWSYQLAPLVWAIQYQRPEMVKLLLEHQADPNAVPSVASISAQASFKKSPPGNLHPFPFGTPNEYDTSDVSQKPWAVFPPVAGETPLMLAATAHHNVEMGQPFTPGNYIITHVATEKHGAEMVQLLLDHGAKPNAADPDGWTALIYAIGVENSNTVRTLIEHGADVNILDKQGRPPLAHLSTSDTGRQIEEMLIKAGADADYMRRHGIWTSGPGGTPKTELFQCPTNSINHYTLLEFLATLYEDHVQRGFVREMSRIQGHRDDTVPFPDFTRITIHRLDGKRAEILHVNVADIFRSGDRSKDVALQAGDMVEISEREHKVADQWSGLSDVEITALEKCLLRTVRIVVKGTTNDIALLPPRFGVTQERVAEVFNGRKPDTVVGSFLLDGLVRDANILLSTWDLSRVQLTRHGAKITFDLTANPPPEVWLEDGDVIEIPEIGEGAPATGAK
jgi:ankyrin repeat protein